MLDVATGVGSRGSNTARCHMNLRGGLRGVDHDCVREGLVGVMVHSHLARGNFLLYASLLAGAVQIAFRLLLSPRSRVVRFNVLLVG